MKHIFHSALGVLKEIYSSLLISLVLALVIVVGTHIILGQLNSAAYNRHLLDTALQASRYLNSAAIGSSATVMALVLNFIGMSRSSNNLLTTSFSRKLQGLAALSTISLVLGVIGLQSTTLPIISADNVSYNHLPEFYWSFMGLETLLVTLLITIVMVLLQAIWTSIHMAKKGKL